MYPELLKRLDDSSDEIRIAVARTFLAYFDCFRGGYDVGLYRAHLEAIYRGLLLHLDDPDKSIQEAMLGEYTITHALTSTESPANIYFRRF